jgi:hypothetical protein
MVGGVGSDGLSEASALPATCLGSRLHRCIRTDQGALTRRLRDSSNIVPGTGGEVVIRLESGWLSAPADGGRLLRGTLAISHAGARWE